MDVQTVTTDSNGPTLTSIPLEVLLQITSNRMHILQFQYYPHVDISWVNYKIPPSESLTNWVTTPEYGNLRCSCKRIEETLFNSFSREFFSKRQFMFTEFSLQALVDISKSRLSSCLSYVIFGLERPSLRHFSAQIADNLQPEMCIKSNRLRQEYVDHISLRNTGHDVEMLAEAFSNLGKLETIGIRDYYSRSRNRDYPHNEWKSYGVSTYELETGSRLDLPQRFYNFGSPTAEFLEQANYLSWVFLNILRALGKAGSRPKHFEVILRQSSAYDDHAFNLPQYIESTVLAVLSSLRTLLFDLNSEFPPAYVDVDNVPTICPNYFLMTFLSRLPALEHLRLNFRFYRGEETSNLLSWLSKPVPAVTSNTAPGSSLLQLPPPIEFAKLLRLDIGMITVEPQTLLAIIQKHRVTLRTISLHKVSLLQADSAKSRDNLWAKFFGQLSKLDLGLSAINMSLLSQERPGKQHVRYVTFKDSRDPKSRNWGGPDVQSGLRDFVTNVMVTGLDHDTDSSHSVQSDEDNSDDSMQDIDDEDDDE